VLRVSKQGLWLPVGGTKADVQVEQVRDYYRNYYSPNNATLVIVGRQNHALSGQRDFGKVPKEESRRAESRGSRE